MNPTRLPKFYKICISIILTIMQVDRSIEVNIYNNYSISVRHNTDHLLYLSRRYRRQNINSDYSCKIPNNPNSAYQIVNDPEIMYTPGDYVKQFSILEITCGKGYKLPPCRTNTFYCLNGRWNNEPPACLRTCPSLMSTTSTTVECKYNGTPLENCIHPVDGTSVHLSCNTFYEADAINRNPTRTCQNGRWGPISLSECYATCGLKTPKGQSNIISGGMATPGDYPWHVGIYDKTKMFLCGGSIIDRNIILSAAHCLADYGGKAYPASDYLIGAGKYHRQYDDNRDIFPQYSTIRKIFIPNRYKSTNGLNGFDIAVVILENAFTLTASVQPVCVALNQESQDVNYFINNNGTVIGWGYTQEGRELSDVLKELIIPYVQFDKCYNEVPVNFRRYIMFDKICGGYLNQGTAVCQGDSGGGLIYNINNHYFIKGIVSTSPSSTDSDVVQCNSHQYGLYTSVYHHIDFVRNIVTSYGWKDFIECTYDDCTTVENIQNKDSCRLPNFPLHGTYSFSNKSSKYESGNYVLTGSVILLTCDPGYQANPSEEIYFSCVDKGNWNSTLGSCTATPVTNDEVPNNQFQVNDQNVKEAEINYPKFNYFDIELLKAFTTSGTFIISPALIKITLLMLLEGSKGNSAEEISNALGIPVNVTTSGGTINNTLHNLWPKSKYMDVNLEVANLVVVSDNYTLLPEYTKTLQNYNNKTKILSSNFRNTTGTELVVNNWLKKTSNGKIGRIWKGSINNESSLVIVNDLFYYPKFKIKFEQNIRTVYFVQIYNKTFNVVVMQVISQFRYRYFEELHAQIIEIPFADEEFAMLIVLPDENKILDELQTDLLFSDSFATIIASLNTTNVLLSLPQFVIWRDSRSIKILTLLKNLGIQEIFSANANLSGMVEAEKIKVNDIFHNVQIIINNNGDGVKLADSPLTSQSSKKFIAHRPFLYFIYNIESKNILLEGRLGWTLTTTPTCPLCGFAGEPPP